MDPDPVKFGQDPVKFGPDPDPGLQGLQNMSDTKSIKEKRVLKLSKVCIQQNFKNLPSFALQNPVYEFGQNPNPQHW